MKKTLEKFKKLSAFVYAFVALAILFLAVGMGTLGSFASTGKDFELGRVSDTDFSSGPSVVFQLSSSISETVKENGKETTKSTTVRLRNVLVNVGSVYTDAAEAKVELTRSSSKDSFQSYNKLEGTLKGVGEDMGDAFSWVSPFTLPEGGWTLTSYRYYRLRSLDSNVRINEVVFVGEKMDGSDPTGEYAIVPATVLSATPIVGETADEAKDAASALLDKQQLPSEAQSSFYRYSEEEKAILLSLAELRAGNRFMLDANGELLNVYHGDSVYGAFGLDLLALGTAMFGVSPFGLRFFPMFFSFGILVVGFFFARRLTKSDLGGFCFAALYALCNFGFSLGHLGTPLTAGIFFFLLSFDLVHRFYAQGMRHANVLGALPLLVAGLSGAAAICVNGAFVIPLAGVCALYVLAVLRLRKVRRHYLDGAIAAAEGTSDSKTEEGEELTPAERAGKISAEYRYKTVVSSVVFPTGLLLGTLVFSLLFMVPAYFAFVKLYDNIASPVMNVFGLGWRSFAGGFIGTTVAPSAWNWFYLLFRGSGSRYAVTGVVMNCAAALAGAVGIVLAVVRIVKCILAAKKKTFGKSERTALRRTLVPLAGLVLSLVTASFAQGGLAFVALAYLFSFALAAEENSNLLVKEKKSAPAEGDSDVLAKEQKAKKVKTAAVAVGWTVFALLVVLFGLFAAFTFSIPLPATLLTNLFG